MKRVFVALALDDTTKIELGKVQEIIRPLVKKGRYVSSPLFHITLQFLGELEEERVSRLHAMEYQWLKTFNPFCLCINHVGSFKKRNRWILWAGIEKNPHLEHLATILHTSLEKHGFINNHHRFRPHITLARDVQFENREKELAYEATKIDLPPVLIDGIHLMESTQVDGKLYYQSLRKNQFGGSCK